MKRAARVHIVIAVCEVTPRQDGDSSFVKAPRKFEMEFVGLLATSARFFSATHRNPRHIRVQRWIERDSRARNVCDHRVAGRGEPPVRCFTKGLHITRVHRARENRIGHVLDARRAGIGGLPDSDFGTGVRCDFEVPQLGLPQDREVCVRQNLDVRLDVIDAELGERIHNTPRVARSSHDQAIGAVRPGPLMCRPE